MEEERPAPTALCDERREPEDVKRKSPVVEAVPRIVVTARLHGISSRIEAGPAETHLTGLSANL
jgi:hypothetical protein